MTTVLRTDVSPNPSPREQMTRDFAEWVGTRCYSDGSRVFNAPYGVIEGLDKERRSRVVTFGIARIADCYLSIWSAKYMTLNDTRHGTMRFSSIDEVKDVLSQRYNFRKDKS